MTAPGPLHLGTARPRGFRHRGVADRADRQRACGPGQGRRQARRGTNWSSATPRSCGRSAASTGSAAPTPTTRSRAFGCGSLTSWTGSATRPRCPAGWPPPPGGSACGCCICRTGRTPPMYARDVETLPDDRAALAEQGLLAAERQAALREAFAQAAAMRPGADLPAHRGPAAPVRRHQRQAGHPGRQHRPEPQPLPEQDAPPPGHRRPDQRLRHLRRLSSPSTWVGLGWRRRTQTVPVRRALRIGASAGSGVARVQTLDRASRTRALTVIPGPLSLVAEPSVPAAELRLPQPARG